MNRPTLQTSQMLARLIGPVLCAIGVGMLTSRLAYRDIGTQLVMALPLVYITGVLLLVGGLAILNAHNVWVRDWRSIITAFGWFIAAMGTFRIIAPPFASFVGGSLFAVNGFFVVVGVIFIAIGGFLSFKGYVSSPEAKP